MTDLMTSCGCFECICGIEPFSNGAVIVNRVHMGPTTRARSFCEPASQTGGETLTAAGDPEAPVEFLTEKGHPAPGWSP